MTGLTPPTQPPPVQPRRRTRRTLRKRLVRLTIFALISFIVLGYGGFLLTYVYFTVHPAHTDVCCLTPADWGATYVDVTFPGGDDLIMRGWYTPSQNGAAVILLHGYGGNRLEVRTLAEFLASAGYGVLMYDLRGHGESDGETRSYGWQDVEDVAGAIAFMLEQPGLATTADGSPRLGIVGFSVGGQIAIRAAAGDARLLAVAADGTSIATSGDLYAIGPSVPAYFWGLTDSLTDRLIAWRLGIDIPDAVVDEVPRLAGRPLLLIAGGQEAPEPQLAREFHARAAEPKDLWIVDEAGHGETWERRPDEYRQRLTTFFDEALVQPE